MKQEEINVQYIISSQNPQLLQKDYTHFNPTQNYSNNYSYYSPDQLFPTLHSWPYGPFYQQYYPKLNECAHLQPQYFSPNPHNFLYASANEHQS